MSAGITWGKIIAGAGIAAGGVLVGSAVFNDVSMNDVGNNLNDFANKIGSWISQATEWIGKQFTSAPSPENPHAAVIGGVAIPPAPEVAPAAGSGIDWTSPTTKAVIGGGVVGGSLIALSHFKGKEQQAQYDADIAPVDTVPGGFAEREQMRGMQGIMKARMMAANPEYMAAMAGGRAV